METATTISSSKTAKPEGNGRPALTAHPQDIPLSAISVDGRNDREGDDPAAFVGLVESMQAVGLLEPVGVYDSGDKHYQLAYGHRRFAAAKRLGWETISAIIYRGDVDVQQIRGAENLHRRDLTPMEQAFAIADRITMAEERIVEECAAAFKGPPPNLRTLAIQRVARDYAMSETWVRDRSFLAVHTGKARQLVADGRLPITHARELAKIADPALREELAVQVAADGKGGNPDELDRVKRLVGMHQYSLARVPWQLDEAFGGKPACDACEHNSRNRGGLFEHAQPMTATSANYGGAVFKEPEAGVCGLESCFKEKSAMVNRQIATKGAQAARAVLQAPKDDRPSVTPAGLSEFIPSHIKPGLIVERAKEKLKAPPAPKAEAGKPKSKPVQFSVKDTAKEKQTQKHREAMRKWQRAAELDLSGRAAKDPGMFFVLAALIASKGFVNSNRNSKKLAVWGRCVDAAVAAMNMRGTVPGADVLMRHVDKQGVETVVWFDSPEVGEHPGGDWLERLWACVNPKYVPMPRMEKEASATPAKGGKPAKKTGPAKAAAAADKAIKAGKSAATEQDAMQVDEINLPKPKKVTKKKPFGKLATACTRCGSLLVKGYCTKCTAAAMGKASAKPSKLAKPGTGALVSAKGRPAPGTCMVCGDNALQLAGAHGIDGDDEVWADEDQNLCRWCDKKAPAAKPQNASASKGKA